MKNLIAIPIMFFCLLQSGDAQKIVPDPAFGNQGMVTSQLGIATPFPTKGIQIIPGPHQSMYLLCQTKADKTYDQTFITRINNNGEIDKNYGKNGFSNLLHIKPMGAALGKDGKITTLGRSGSDFLLFRYNTNGRLDSTFGNSGKLDITKCNGKICVTSFDLALQNDGKILVAGFRHELTNQFTIERYNKDGTPDSSFANKGFQTVDLSTVNKSANDFFSKGKVTVGPDGKIVIAGYVQYYPYHISAIARFNTDGTLDTTFNGDGKVIMDLKDDNGNPFELEPSSVLVQDDGRILVAGLGIARYRTNGTPDSSFSDDGLLPIPLPNPGTIFCLQTDGRILALIAFKNVIGLTRYFPDGSTDSSFSGNASAIPKKSQWSNFSLALEEDGKVLLSGTNKEGFVVASFTKDGNFDSSFKSGKLSGGYPEGRFTSFNNLAVQRDGKMIVSASGRIDKNTSGYFLSRYNIDGSIDSTFGGDGTLASDFDPTSMAVDNAGKLVIAGLIADMVSFARYNTDGTRDTSFHFVNTDQYSYDGSSIPFVIQKDDKLVWARTLRVRSEFDLSSTFEITRYNTNGTPDSTFHYNNSSRYLGEEGFCTSMGILSNGNILVGGTSIEFRTVNGVLVLFDSSGNFVSGYGANFSPYEIEQGVHSITVQRDQNVVVQGDVGPYRVLARYKPDGSLDGSFGVNGITVMFDETTSGVYNTGVATQDNGKLVMTSIRGLIRFNSNGQLDSSFNWNQIRGHVGDAVNHLIITGKNLYTAGAGPLSGETVGELGAYIVHDDSLIYPTLSLITPPDNTSYRSGESIHLNAIASDADGSISKVEFYSDTILLFTAIDSPYTFTWTNVSKGNYALTAKATDNSGLVTTSDPVRISVVDNLPPVVHITSPAINRNFVIGEPIVLGAEATDPDGTIQSVDFYSDSTLLFTQSEYPYSRRWDSVPTGKYRITAVATDNLGTKTTSAPVHITVLHNRLPVVNITSPLDGSTYEAPGTGANIIVSADATAHGGKIKTVEFYSGTKLIHTETYPPFVWKWQNVPAGSYIITARATDSYGRVKLSDPVTIMVRSVSVALAPNKGSLSGNQSVVSVEISPNPANDRINITTTGLNNGKASILSIISFSGAIVQVIKIVGASQLASLNIGSLAPGMYTIKLVNGNQVRYRKFVKM